MKRFFLFGLLILSVAGFVLSNLAANAAPPAQDPTPKGAATRRPTRQRTRVPQATEVPTAPVPAAKPEILDAEDASAAALAPSSPGPMSSQILIFNPDTSGQATVQIDVYNTGGGVAYTTTVNVAKNGARLVSLPGSLGTNFQGGAQISSDKNVQAIVIGANSNNSARDAYQGSNAPALNVTLPFVRHLAADTQNSILAIQNTTDTSANISVTLYNLDGSTATTQNAAIAAHQVVYYNTNSLVPSPPFVGSARVTSDQNIAVAMQSLYYKDTAAFLGMTASEMDTTLWLNQAQRKINNVNAAVNWSEIHARNNGTNPTDITIEFFTAAGAPVTSQTASAVPANGTAEFFLNDAAFAALGNNYNGWAKITSTGEPFAVSALQVISKGKRLVGTNALANSQTAGRYICGDAERNTTQNSRLSVLNTDPTRTAKVILRLFNKETGAKVVNYKVSVPPNTRSLFLLSDSAFAGAGTDYQGMALVQIKGATPPRVIVTVDTPYAVKKPVGTTGYTCTKVP